MARTWSISLPVALVISAIACLYTTNHFSLHRLAVRPHHLSWDHERCRLYFLHGVNSVSLHSRRYHRFWGSVPASFTPVWPMIRTVYGSGGQSQGSPATGFGLITVWDMITTSSSLSSLYMLLRHAYTPWYYVSVVIVLRVPITEATMLFSYHLWGIVCGFGWEFMTLITHIDLILKNLTTIEFSEGVRALQLVEGAIHEHPYDFGAAKNLSLILGPSIPMWVWPTSEYIGSGLQFLTIFDNQGAASSRR